MASGGEPSSEKESADPDRAPTPIVLPSRDDKVQVAYRSKCEKGGYLKAIYPLARQARVRAKGDYHEDSTCFIWNNHIEQKETYYLSRGPPGDTEVVCLKKDGVGLILKKAPKDEDKLPEDAFLFKVEQPRPGKFSLRHADNNRLVVVHASGNVATIEEPDMEARSRTAKNLPHPSSLCEIYIKESGAKQVKEVIET